MTLCRASPLDADRSCPASASVLPGPPGRFWAGPPGSRALPTSGPRILPGRARWRTGRETHPRGSAQRTSGGSRDQILATGSSRVERRAAGSAAEHPPVSRWNSSVHHGSPAWSPARIRCGPGRTGGGNARDQLPHRAGGGVGPYLGCRLHSLMLIPVTAGTGEKWGQRTPSASLTEPRKPSRASRPMADDASPTSGLIRSASPPTGCSPTGWDCTTHSVCAARTCSAARAGRRCGRCVMSDIRMLPTAAIAYVAVRAFAQVPDDTRDS